MSLITSRLSSSDVTVITILWACNIFDTWIRTLCIYTSKVFFAEEIESRGFVYQELAVFVFQCLAAFMLAFLVDTGRFPKYVVCAIGLCIYALTPIFALLTILTSNMSSVIVMFFTASFMFIASPVVYCLIFNQNLNAGGRQLRVLVSIFEFVNSLSSYLVVLLYPKTFDNDARYRVIVIWVMVTPLLVTLITLVERIKMYVRGDISVDRNIKSLMVGLREDLSRKHHGGRSVIHVVFFKLLLLPAISLTVLDSSMVNASSGGSGSPHPTLVLISHTVQLLMIPLVELIITMTPKLSETSVNLTALCLAHIANVVVLLIIISRMKVIPTRGELESTDRVKRGVQLILDNEWPPTGFATYFIINTRSSNVLVSFSKDDTKNYLAPASVAHSTIQTRSEGKTVPVFLALDDPGNPRRKEMFLTPGRFHFYMISGEKSSLGWHYIKGLDNLLEEMPQFVIVVPLRHNSVHFGGVDILGMSGLRINSTESGFEWNNKIPPFFEPIIVKVPPADTTVNYRFFGTDKILKKRFPNDTVTVKAEKYQLYVMCLLYLGRIKVYSMRITNGPPTTPQPTTTPEHTLKPPDQKEVASYAVAGASLGIASVGYTHFFWTQSPVRLRATIFAVFRVINAIAWRLTPVIFGKALTLTGAHVLLALEVLTTIAHLVLSWIFETKIEHHGVEL